MKKTILINIIIGILIVLPLIYLVVKSNNNNAGASKSLQENNTLNNPIDSAKTKLQTVIDLAKSIPNESNYINLSLEFYLNRKYNECAEAAKKALEYNIHSYAAYNNICSAYNQLGLWEEAIIAGKKALAEKPGDELAQNNLKASIKGKENLDKSIIDIEALAKTTPNETNLSKLAFAYYQARKYELSIISYKKVIQINKKNIIAYNNICSAYNQLGKYKEAATYCESALKIDSTYTLSQNNLIEAQNKLKQKQLIYK